jgi:vacuolar-type H+-ATPase subunit H
VTPDVFHSIMEAYGELLKLTEYAEEAQKKKKDLLKELWEQAKSGNEDAQKALLQQISRMAQHAGLMWQDVMLAAAKGARSVGNWG